MRETASMLLAGVPLKRGTPKHFEHFDDTAVTCYDKSGKVIEIHTPQETLRRVHELMHARSSDLKRQNRQYKRVNASVRDLTEDCVIHERHWPWRRKETPAKIARDTLGYIASDLARADKCKQAIADRTAKDMAGATWANFAYRLRAKAVLDGMGHSKSVGFTEAESYFADDVLYLVRRGKEGKAAEMLQAAFFPPPPIIDFPPLQRGEKKDRGSDPNTANQPKMEVIELQHSESIPDAVVGIRIASSGPRLHRPALRKPVLPSRCFVRRSPQEAGGTILVDASGSMGGWDQVKDWCEKAPFGTIAYYAGNNRIGWLYIYARDGMRAREIVRPGADGNTVDGPAMDWLMAQEAPRIMVTDRRFCGADDSHAQIVRLASLEACGEITVKDYSK